MRRVTLLIYLSAFWVATATAQLTASLQSGPHAVGFKIMDAKDQSRKPIRLCIWYPTSEKGNPMKLSDYVEISSLGGTQEPATLRSDLKRVIELPFVMGLSSGQISQNDFDKALTTTTLAIRDAKVKMGKWPLVISDTEPSMLVVTNEYLASNGFIVAVPAMQYPNSDDVKTRFEGPTRGLEAVLNYMLLQFYVDAKNISAIGFGGGAIASFYAAMRTSKITSLINIEGALFMPETQITSSVDYKPDQFKIPLLHVVNPYIVSKESVAEFNAVRSKKYRLMEGIRLRHHDFTIYGKIVNDLLHLRGQGSEEAIKAYQELHQHILSFLRNKKMVESGLSSSQLFKLEIF